MASHLHTKILKKSLWDGIRFSENISLCEDYDVLTYIVPNAQKVFYLHENLYYYRQTAGSIVHNISLHDMRNAYRLVKERYLFFSQAGYDVDKAGIAYAGFCYMQKIILNENLANIASVYQDLYAEMKIGLQENYNFLLERGLLGGKDKFKIYLFLHDMQCLLRFLLKGWLLIKKKIQI